MAGAGYKLFNTGDVLTAAQVNTYLMEQTVMVFDDAASRTTALTGVVSEGMISYLKDTNAVEVYNGSAWVASDDPNAIQNTIVDAKGDLITATSADTPARLAVGSNFAFLQADSAQSTGLLWNNASWTSYTPTITAGSGTFTSVTASGVYTRIGKLCVFEQIITITTNGTAAGSVRASLPFTGSANTSVGAGREVNVTGKMVNGQIETANVIWRNYDDSYPGGTGYKIIGSGSYEVA